MTGVLCSVLSKEKLTDARMGRGLEVEVSAATCPSKGRAT